MKTLPVTDNFEDVHQHLRDGIVRVPGARIPYASYRGYDPDSDRVELAFIPSEGDIDQQTMTFPRSDVKIVWPMCGSINMPDRRHAVHVVRTTQRQWRRAFTMRFCHTVRLDGGSVPAAHRVLQALLYPTWLSWEDARLSLDSGWSSVAMNRQFTVVRSTRSNLVYDGTVLIGRVTNEGSLIGSSINKFVRRRWEEAVL